MAIFGEIVSILHQFDLVQAEFHAKRVKPSFSLPSNHASFYAFSIFEDLHLFFTLIIAPFALAGVGSSMDDREIYSSASPREGTQLVSGTCASPAQAISNVACNLIGSSADNRRCGMRNTGLQMKDRCWRIFRTS